MLTFQELIFKLQSFWSKQGCILLQPYDLNMGAATFHPATSLKSLGPDPWKVAYLQPCRRPTDGRYGENPNRLQHYFQFQVLIKPSPKNAQDLFLDSLKNISIDFHKHDIKFLEDNWESPTLGAAGLGWEVQCNGTEISQFTYFQQMGGYECNPVSVEFTYGLERIATFIQKVDSLYDIIWNKHGVTYGDLYLKNEKEFSKFNFEYGWVGDQKEDYSNFLFEAENAYKKNITQLLDQKLLYPAYEECLRYTHFFNQRDAGGEISVSKRQSDILEIRSFFKKCCQLYLESLKK